MNQLDKTEDIRAAPERAVGQAIQGLTAARLGRGFIYIEDPGGLTSAISGFFVDIAR
jgi:hypothetical protein